MSGNKGTGIDLVPRKGLKIMELANPMCVHKMLFDR